MYSQDQFAYFAGAQLQTDLWNVEITHRYMNVGIRNLFLEKHKSDFRYRVDLHWGEWHYSSSEIDLNHNMSMQFSNRQIRHPSRPNQVHATMQAPSKITVFKIFKSEEKKCSTFCER